MAFLYIVGTPIGNLGDITLRALETFKAVNVIACEDTRHTLQLLTHFDIRKPLISCRAGNEAYAAHKIIEILDSGQDIAFASDAGTPALSDPGAVLVESVRVCMQERSEQAHLNVPIHSIVPIPGCSAFATLLSVAGNTGKTVVFEGFLSPKPGRRRSRLRELLATGWAFVLYESPFRVVKLLRDIADIESERHIVIGRELTKLHEEICAGSAEEIAEEFAQRQRVLGEFSVLVAGNKHVQKNEETADK